ncbi:uncharacterized protein VTP21DRAFT_11491 [Calcarisporiella thermophila]|uniref:uncharacterized protein n=1 Tax=Calcarisporiella thermophila TaxID=911321 RepID=UPI00374268B2
MVIPTPRKPLSPSLRPLSPSSNPKNPKSRISRWLSTRKLQQKNDHSVIEHVSNAETDPRKHGRSASADHAIMGIYQNFSEHAEEEEQEEEEEECANAGAVENWESSLEDEVKGDAKEKPNRRNSTGDEDDLVLVETSPNGFDNENYEWDPLPESIAPRNSGQKSALSEYPGLDVLLYWLNGPQIPYADDEVAGAVNGGGKKRRRVGKEGGNGQGGGSGGLLEMAWQFIALLTYPDLPPQQKRTFAELKQITFVRNRRRMLLFLTIYCLVLRYSSFDLYIILLLASNCGLLWLMKNSGKVNVNMAKRAIRQRIRWTKEWAGNLFRSGDKQEKSIEDPSNDLLPITATSPEKPPTKSLSKRTMFFRRSRSPNIEPTRTPSEISSASAVQPPAPQNGEGRGSKLGKKRLFKGKEPASLPQQIASPVRSPSILPEVPTIEKCKTPGLKEAIDMQPREEEDRGVFLLPPNAPSITNEYPHSVIESAVEPSSSTPTSLATSVS